MTNHNDHFEELAAEFYGRFHCLAPGKDGPSTHYSEETVHKSDVWKLFCEAKILERKLEKVTQQRDDARQGIAYLRLPPTMQEAVDWGSTDGRDYVLEKMQKIWPEDYGVWEEPDKAMNEQKPLSERERLLDLLGNDVEAIRAVNDLVTHIKGLKTSKPRGKLGQALRKLGQALRKIAALERKLEEAENRAEKAERELADLNQYCKDNGVYL